MPRPQVSRSKKSRPQAGTPPHSQATDRITRTLERARSIQERADRRDTVKQTRETRKKMEEEKGSRIPFKAREKIREVVESKIKGRGQGKGLEKASKKTKAIQPEGHVEPTAPYAKQHQTKPGSEARMEPRPEYLAPTYRGSEKLKDKVALITGGDSGIGRAVAVLYAREGADVAIVYLNEHEDAEETKRAVEAEGRRAILIPGDVTSSKFCKQSVERTVKELGKLDIVVNNAAFQEHASSLEELSEDQWDLTFKTNIYGYFYIAKAAIPHLKPGSVILNTGSINAFRGNDALIDYSATKGAIHTFTKALAKSLVEKGIRVNCVAPGPVWTPFIPSDSPADSISDFGTQVPMKRAAQPEEIAPAYVFFASSADSSYITGEVLGLFGGEIVS